MYLQTSNKSSTTLLASALFFHQICNTAMTKYAAFPLRSRRWWWEGFLPWFPWPWSPFFHTHPCHRISMAKVILYPAGIKRTERKGEKSEEPIEGLHAAAAAPAMNESSRSDPALCGRLLGSCVVSWKVHTPTTMESWVKGTGPWMGNGNKELRVYPTAAKWLLLVMNFFIYSGAFWKIRKPRKREAPKWRRAQTDATGKEFNFPLVLGVGFVDSMCACFVYVCVLL